MRWQKILILVVYILAVDRVYAKPKKGKGKGKGKKKGGGGKSGKSCSNINVGAKPCSGSGTYKSLLDFAGSAAGQSAASADLATKMIDYSVQEVDWAKAVAKGSCKALPTCNAEGRSDGVKGRKDISNKMCGLTGSKLAAAFSGWSISYLNKEKKSICK